jgi:predicted DNA-binding protein (UPF0251 family)
MKNYHTLTFDEAMYHIGISIATLYRRISNPRETLKMKKKSNGERVIIIPKDYPLVVPIEE